MGEFASKGVAGAGLGLGIAGTALGVLNGGCGNLLGGYGRNYGGYGFAGYGYGGYGDVAFSEALAERDAEIARLSAKAYSDESDLTLYKYLDEESKEPIFYDKCKTIWEWETRLAMDKVLLLKYKMSQYRNTR